MNYAFIEYASYSIGIASFIGLVRFRKIDQAYYPFIILLWVGSLNELVNTLVINAGYSNAINSNLYILFESMLILWFFKRQHLFQQQPKLVWIFVTLYAAAWLTELSLFSIRHFISYFTILYSFITVLMSISMINRLLMSERKLVIKHPLFIICVGFILFFTVAVLVETFWAYGLGSSKQFGMQVYRIQSYTNLITNFIFVFAVLWIPRKQVYTLL